MSTINSTQKIPRKGDEGMQTSTAPTAPKKARMGAKEVEVYPISEACKTVLEKVVVDHPDLRALVIQVEGIRIKLANEKEAAVINKNQVNPYSMIVTNHTLHVVLKEVGNGSYSDVYFTEAIEFKDGSCSKKIIKSAEIPFEDEIKMLEMLSPDSKASFKIDHFAGSFFAPQEKLYLGVFQPSDCDFTKVDYHKLQSPVSFICRQLIDVCEGIASFHRRDIILRDIKGRNLLINYQGPGKVTDFGFLMKMAQPGTKHEALGTVLYVAPYIWDSILGQKYWNRKQASFVGGYQGKASDLFSIGRVIQFDVLRLMISQLGERYQVPVLTFVMIESTPRKQIGKFTDEQLEAFEQSAPGRVLRDANSSKDQDILYIFDAPEMMYGKTVEQINKFKGKIPDAELKKMEKLAELAKELQNPSKQGLLDFLKKQNESAGDELVQEVLKQLHKILTPAAARALIV